MWLWGYSGAVRAKTGVAINPEDSARFKAKLESADPDAVARVMRAYNNAAAMITPFLILGWLYVVIGGHTLAAEIIFGFFIITRYAHSICYLKGVQPFRTVMFTLSAAGMLALLVALCIRLVQVV